MGGGEEGSKQGRLMGDDGNVINWSIYAGLPIPLYDPAPPLTVLSYIYKNLPVLTVVTYSGT